jgi:hypothetical protein
MTTESIAFRAARQFVHSYQGEYKDLMEEHGKAMDCWDCQSFLQLGIDAFNWITRTDQEIKKAIFEKRTEYDQNVDLAIASLYAEWLKPCEFAEQWIRLQKARDFKIDNLVQFQKCCEEARAIVECNEGILSNPNFIVAQEDALEAYRKGETLGF